MTGEEIDRCFFFIRRQPVESVQGQTSPDARLEVQSSHVRINNYVPLPPFVMDASLIFFFLTKPYSKDS